MNYLKRPRARIMLACCIVSSLLLVGFSGIDIHISKLFFDQRFYLANQRWARLLHDGVGYFLCLTMIAVVAVYAVNKFAKRNLYGVDGKKVLYLLLVLILGAGLIVNVAFKDSFGRARPRDVEEFGGSHRFTPAFVISHECNRNCSFSSGDGAGAFFALALAACLSRKRVVMLAALAFGSLVSFARIASGAHFFSDTVVSFFVMLIVTDVLHHYIILGGLESVPIPDILVPPIAGSSPPIHAVGVE